MKKFKLITGLASACVLTTGLLTAQTEPRQDGEQEQQFQQRQQQEQQQQYEQQEQRQQQQPPGAEAQKQDGKISEQELKKQVTDINRASRLIGMSVRNKQDENIGRVSDIVIDLDSGKVAYAVLSTGGFFGLGGKLIAVPLQSFTPQPGDKNLLLDMDRQTLEQAPGFAQNEWPNLDAVQEGQIVGLTPRGEEDPEAVGGTADTARSGTISQLQELTTGDAETLEGRRVNLTNARVQDVHDNKIVILSSPQGERVMVRSTQGLQNVQAGQTVSVSGTVRRLPTDLETLGLGRQTAELIRGQTVYVEATQVKPSNQ